MSFKLLEKSFFPQSSLLTKFLHRSTYILVVNNKNGYLFYKNPWFSLHLSFTRLSPLKKSLSSHLDLEVELWY